MSKYSYELKLEVVQAYQRGKGGYRHLATEYGITNKSQVKQWVKQFEANGKDGLKKSKKSKIPFRFQAICGRMLFNNRNKLSRISTNVENQELCPYLPMGGKMFTSTVWMVYAKKRKDVHLKCPKNQSNLPNPKI